MTSYIQIISENIFISEILIKQSNALKILPLIAPGQFLIYSSWLGGQLETLPLLQQPIQTDKSRMYQPHINHQTCSTKGFFFVWRIIIQYSRDLNCYINGLKLTPSVL